MQYLFIALLASLYFSGSAKSIFIKLYRLPISSEDNFQMKNSYYLFS